jgi:uncharacterized protein YqgC (DUF456 family)
VKKISKKLFPFLFLLAFTAIKVDNPAPGLFTEYFGTDIRTIIGTIITLLVGFAGLISVAFVILGGYQIATARGNEEMAKNGRKTLTNAIIGLVIIILSYVIISVVVNAAFGTVRNNGGNTPSPSPSSDISA